MPQPCQIPALSVTYTTAHSSNRCFNPLSGARVWTCILMFISAEPQQELPTLFFGGFFLLFRAAPEAYGGSQARGLIGATAAGLHHSHSKCRIRAMYAYTAAHGNTGFLTHWAKPGIKPATSWFLVGFVSASPLRELLVQFSQRKKLSLGFICSVSKYWAPSTYYTLFLACSWTDSTLAWY